MRDDTLFFRSGDVYDALIISDLHLGARVCRAAELLALLKAIEGELIHTRSLVLNGDVFDSIDFRRLRRQHWNILSTFRRLSKHTRIVWVCGNHDGPAEVVSHLLGVDVADEHVVHSAGERMLVLHGHTFDDFIDEHPVMTLFADGIYRLLQLIDRSHGVARRAKYGSKTFLRCVEKVRDGATAYAAMRGFRAVSCGHTHHASVEEANGVRYYNSGCWTERPCTLLTVMNGNTQLHTFESFLASWPVMMIAEENGIDVPVPIIDNAA